MSIHTGCEPIVVNSLHMAHSNASLHLPWEHRLAQTYAVMINHLLSRPSCVVRRATGSKHLDTHFCRMVTESLPQCAHQHETANQTLVVGNTKVRAHRAVSQHTATLQLYKTAAAVIQSAQNLSNLDECILHAAHVNMPQRQHTLKVALPAVSKPRQDQSIPATSPCPTGKH